MEALATALARLGIQAVVRVEPVGTTGLTDHRLVIVEKSSALLP
jgi:hypothetical protein